MADLSASFVRTRGCGRGVRGLIAVIVLGASACALRPTHTPPGSASLYLATTVFIESRREPDTERHADTLKRLESALAPALARRGFVVAGSAEGADAIIRVETGVWITVDGPPEDPPRFSFDGELFSVRTAHHLTWRTQFDLRSRAEASVVEEQGMQKVADNLFRAWKDSAVRAGKITKSEAKHLERIVGSRPK